MIGFLKGKVITSNEQHLILDVSSVGYKVLCPLPLLLSIQDGDDLQLHIHTHVREDQLNLYGFKTKEDLFIFEKLINISGIGPKSALSMLSIHSPSSLANIVENEDVQSLSHTPGVGKKTAEKIIIELRGKLKAFSSSENNDSLNEVRMALDALGYSPKEVSESLRNIKSDGKTTGDLIKEVLSTLK